MTNAHQPREDRMHAFIVTGTYLAERRITSPELSAAVAKSLALSFAEPVTLMSYILPTMKSPLVYELRTVWMAMSDGDREDLYLNNKPLFNAITMLLRAVPERATDESDAAVGESGTATGVQIVSERITP